MKRQGKRQEHDEAHMLKRAFKIRVYLVRAYWALLKEVNGTHVRLSRDESFLYFQHSAEYRL